MRGDISWTHTLGRSSARVRGFDVCGAQAAEAEGLFAEAFDYVAPPEARPGLPPAVTAEQAIGDLPPIEPGLSSGPANCDAVHSATGEVEMPVQMLNLLDRWAPHLAERCRRYRAARREWERKSVTRDSAVDRDASDQRGKT